MKNELKNKVVLITGASSGIGAALAAEYARNGANVILLARRIDLITKKAAELSRKFNKCIAVRGDVNKDGDLENAVKEGLKHFNKIDIVIANAGIGVPGNLEDLNLAAYRKQFETSVFGVLRTIYANLQELKKTKGNLCIIGSVNGLVSFSTGASAYTMSKFAIRGLAKSLSLEFSPYGISVTHIMPGFVDTNFNVKPGERAEKKYRWLKISPEKAAELISQAIKNRDLEAVLTRHGKMAVYMERFAPFLLRELGFLFSKIFK